MKTSVITYNRNDGYKENERFVIHLKTLLDTFDEVNYVDWNSPTRSFLYEVIDEIPKTGKLKHFIITPEIHNFLFKDVSPAVPNTMNPLAVNLAMRRTDADWIVLTTSDNIPPLKDELKEFLEKADKNTFYTFSRRDIEYDEVLKNTNNLTEYRKSLSTLTQPRYFPAKVTPNDEYSLINCCGDFQLAHKDLWMNIKGTEEGMIYNCFVDTNIQKKAVLYGYNLQAIFDIPLYHMSHQNQLPQGGDTTNLHKNAKDMAPPVYNDAWDWVERFTESQNTDSWGFNDTEIEFEIF